MTQHMMQDMDRLETQLQDMEKKRQRDRTR